jgi:hypothetical protein
MTGPAFIPEWLHPEQSVETDWNNRNAAASADFAAVLDGGFGANPEAARLPWQGLLTVPKAAGGCR